MEQGHSFGWGLSFSWATVLGQKSLLGWPSVLAQGPLFMSPFIEKRHCVSSNFDSTFGEFSRLMATKNFRHGKDENYTATLIN